MAMLLRLLSAYLLLSAAVVALKFIFATPQPSWDVINWFMAGGIITVLGGAIFCKRSLAADDSAGDDVQRFLDVNVPLYAAAALLIAFAFQWFAELSWHVKLSGHTQVEPSVLWAYIDAAYVPITGMMGVRFWSAAERA